VAFCIYLNIQKKSPFEGGFRGMFCVKYIPPQPSLLREGAVFNGIENSSMDEVPLRRGI
jgi:hypothetical protein